MKKHKWHKQKGIFCPYYECIDCGFVVLKHERHIIDHNCDEYIARRIAARLKNKPRTPSNIAITI